MTDSLKRKTALFSACIVLAVFTAVSYSCSTRVHSRLFRSGCGWGYDIVCNGRTVIHQPFIPALPGEKVFPDRRSARKVAGLVAGKIRAGESPAVSTEEILELMPEFRR